MRRTKSIQNISSFQPPEFRFRPTVHLSFSYHKSSFSLWLVEYCISSSSLWDLGLSDDTTHAQTTDPQLSTLSMHCEPCHTSRHVHLDNCQSVSVWMISNDLSWTQDVMHDESQIYEKSIQYLCSIIILDHATLYRRLVEEMYQLNFRWWCMAFWLSLVCALYCCSSGPRHFQLSSWQVWHWAILLARWLARTWWWARTCLLNGLLHLWLEQQAAWGESPLSALAICNKGSMLMYLIATVISICVPITPPRRN